MEIGVLLILFLFVQFSLQDDDGICRDIEKPPVGFYPFHKTTQGLNIYSKDYSPEAYFSSVSYVADIDGVRDNAIKLLGTKDSYVEIPRSKLLDTTKSITIILSVYPTGDEGDIFTYRTTGGGVSLLQRESSQGTTSTVFIRFIKRSLKLLEALEDDVLVKNEWNIIATSYDYQTGDAKLYRNGKHIKTINIGTNYIATQFPIRLGAIQKSLTPYKGHLSCLQIYDFAMDIKDIIQSQYVCRKASTVLQEAIVEIDRKEFTEPFDQVKVIIQEANADVNIFVNFGDGAKEIHTTGREVTHAYEKEGVYEIQVEFCLGCRSNQILRKFPIHVYMYVEEPAKLDMESFITTLGEESQLKATLEKGSYYNCTWNFGDGTEDIVTVHNNVKESKISHNYTTAGIYMGHVQCYNRKAKLTKQFKATIQESINGLEIEDITPKLITQNYKVSWTLKTGSTPKYKVTVNGKPASFKTSDNDLKGEVSIHPHFFDNTPGTYTIQVEVKNDVSKTITAEKSFVVYPEILPVTIKASKRIYEMNETVDLIAQSENKEFNGYPSYTWDFGDGNTVVNQDVNHTTHQYVMYGPKRIEVVTSNPVNNQLNFLEVNVLRPVLHLQSLQCHTLPVAEEESTTLKCTMRVGSDFKCKVDWHGFENNEKDLSAYQYYINQSLSTEHLQNIRFQDQYKFKEPGCYDVMVSCDNRLSQISNQTKAIVQVVVTDIHIEEIPPQVFGDRFRISWQTKTGTDVVYHIYWNNKDLGDSVLRDGKPSFEISQEIYNQPGVHTFMVKASNLITEEIEKSIQIIIEHPVVSFNFQINTVNEFLEVGEEMNVQFAHTNGTDVKYHVLYGDNSGLYTWHNNHTKSYEDYGTFMVNVAAFNNISKINVSKEIVVLKPVLPLGQLEITAPKENVSESVEITGRLTVGTDFRCVLNYGDGNEYNTTLMFSEYFTNEKNKIERYFQNIVLKFQHAYSRPQVYTLNLQCSNRLSKTEASTTVKIYRPVLKFEIQVPEMNEENTPVEFKISDENEIEYTEHEYFIQYGDGGQFSTTENQFSYVYTEFGTYDVIVTAENPVSKIQITKRITVMKPVLALKGLRVSASPVNVTNPTVLEISLEEGSDFNCSIQWTPDHMILLNKMDMRYLKELKKSDFQNIRFQSSYIIGSQGTHTVSVSCANRLGSVSMDRDVIVQEPLKGFFLIPTLPQVFGESFHIEFTVESGSELDITFTFNGKVIPTLDKQSKVLITPDMYTQPGIIKYSMSGSNLVTQEITRYGEVIIDKKIEDIQLNIISEGGNVLEINQTVQIQAIASKGSNVLYSIDYNNGHTVKDVQQNVFDYSYDTYGEFVAKISAYNNISRISRTTQLTILKPVLPLAGLRITTVSQMNVSTPYSIQLELDQGSDFSCEIDFNDGETFNTSIQHADYYTTTHRMDKTLFTNLDVTTKHAFSRPGKFHIKVACKNRLNMLSDETEVRVNIPMTEFTVLASKNVAEINETIDFQITGLDVTTDPTFTVDGGKYTPALTTKEFEFEKSFSHYGSFEIEVTATNPTSTQTRRIKIEILKPVLQLEDLSISVQPTNITAPTVLKLKIKKGSDFTCSVQWDQEDEASLDSETFTDYVFFKEGSLDETPFQDIAIEFEHTYSKIGFYIIQTECSNRKNYVTAAASVDVQVPIAGFQLIPVIPQRVGTSFQVQWVKAKGTEVEYIVTWEDQDLQYQRLNEDQSFAPVTIDNYKRAGIYTYTVTAKNKVSDAGALVGKVILEDQILDLDVKVKNPASEFEVNETVTAQVSISSGTNPRFKYNKGDGYSTTQNLTRKEWDISYTKQGIYTLKVIAKNYVSLVEDEVQIRVIKPVIPVTQISLRVSQAYDLLEKAEIIVDIEKGSDLICAVMYGDGEKDTSEIINGHYYEKGKKEKMADFVDFQYNFLHTYKETGTFDVAVTCSNRLSSQSASAKIHIQQSLSKVFIQPITPKKIGEEFLVKFKVGQGSNVTYHVHFQDQIFSLVSKSSDEQSLTLQSNKRGIFKILINASNHVTETIMGQLEVIIEQPIIGLKTISPEPNQEFEVDETFQFCFEVDDASNPKYDVKINDKEFLGLNQACVEHKFPLHDNFTDGQPSVSLPLHVIAYNNVSKSEKIIYVILLKPVLQLEYKSLECLPAITGQVSRLSLILSGSDFICSWDLETKDESADELSNVFHKNKNSDVADFQNILKQHEEAYKKANTYLATVSCANRLNSFVQSAYCYVQDDIQNIIIDPIKAKLFGSSPNITWTTEIGTNITYDVIFNNHVMEVQSNEERHFIIITKKHISQPGYYHGLITASNMINSNYSKGFMIKFEKDLRIADVSITYEDSPKKGEREGHGEDNTYFPVEKTINFAIETNTDDFIAVWEIYFNGKLEVNKTSKAFGHTFKTPGERMVHYRVFNNISTVSGGLGLTFIEPVGFLLMTTNSPQRYDEFINFTIIMPQKGQETCFVLDTGDGNQYYYTTENGDCGIFYPNKTIHISGIFPKHQSELFVSHLYANWSFYKASVIAINHLSRQNYSVVVLASEVKCQFPDVNMTNLGATPFHATRLAKSEKMTAFIDVKINCEYTSKAVYRWSIFKYNPDTGKLAPVKFDNKTDYGFDPYIMKDLIIKKKTLHYGTYLLKVTVTMNDPKASIFKTSGRGYLQVYPSTLISAIEGGALIRRGVGKMLPFSGAISYDPDIGRKRFDGMNFTWLCFNSMETPPGDFAEKHVLPNYKVAILNPQPYDPKVVRQGGCFGNGTYFFQTKDEKFELDTNRMIPEHTYVIMLLLTKGERATVGSQVLELVKGLPPELGIQCAENCMEKINPSGKLALMGTCKGDVCSEDIKYEWEVYKVKNQTAEGKIIWELDEDVMKAVEQYRKELVFVVKKFILTPGKLYRFTLIGGVEGGPKGLSQRNGLTNTPPKNGECVAEQEQGAAMETLFTFRCDGWEDEDVPLRYEFVYFNEQGAESLFLFGISNVAEGKLPLGDEKTNFTTRMEARIIDAFDATAKVTLYVRVVEPKLTEDEMIAKLLNMTQGENSELEKIVNSGDTQAIAKLMNSVSSILNKNSDTAGKRKKVRSDMLAHLSQNGTLHVNGSILFHNGTVLHSNATAVLNNGTIVQKNGTVFHPNGTTHDNGTWLFGNNTGLNITELTEEQRRQRDREAIRTAMIVALSNQKATSIEAMRQNADVMGSLTKSKGEVTAESQESSAGSMMGMAGQLSGESSDEDGAGSDAVEAAAGTMASGLGNIIGSASGSAKAKVIPKPTTTPAPSTTVSILGFEMLFSDEEEEVIVSDEDEDYVETDPAKLKAQSTVAGVFSAAGAVGGSMTGKKLPGEESTVIDSPSMAMASGQVDPNKMGAPVCSPSGAGFKMPSNGNLFKNAGNDTEMNAVGQQMMALNDNPFTWDPKGGVSGTVTSVTLGGGGGKGMNVSEADEPIEITMPREGETEPPTVIEFPPLTQKYVYHKVEIKKNNTAFTAHIIPQNYSEPPFNGSVMLGIYVRRSFRPIKGNADWSMIFPKESNETYDPCNPPPPEKNYTLFISDKYLSEGVYWIGVSYLQPPGMPDDALVNVTLNYTLRIFTSQCKYWSDEKNKWLTDGCNVGPKTDLTKTHCLCNHLTSFGGGMITAPAPIDFSKVFAGFKDMFASGNVSVFFTILGMFGLYILLGVYSRRMDKKEERQMGVTPIFNAQDPDSNYQYEVTFFTHRGSKSSTSANVFCNIVGTKGETGPLALKDTERILFLPAAVNSFLIMVPKSLGEIQYIRVWHDNSGYYPSWNLHKINMKDLQTKDTWIFLGGWLAIDEGDFEIDKTIKPATEDDLSDFKLVFQEKLMQDLGDAHIWFSIFMRPPTSRFTRLQRLSCCLTILCLTMVASAMFYGAGPASAADDANAISIGPITVSIKMIIIGVQSSIVVVPPNVLIVWLFSSAKRRHAITIEGSLKKARERKEREENGESEEEETTSSCCCFKRKRKRKPKSKGSCFRCCRRKSDDTDSEEEFNDIGEEYNEGYGESLDGSSIGRRSRTSTRSRASTRSTKPYIRGYYQSSDEGSSEDTFVSSSEEEDTSPETDEDPLLNADEINEMEKDASILIKDEEKEENPDIITKILAKVMKKKKLSPEEKLEKERKEVEALEKQIHGSLPWWVIYPAWVLVFFASTCPALFTLFYSMMWGKDKSNAWLTTQALSFFQDTFVSRPVKIIVITSLVAFLLKKRPKDDLDELPLAEPLQEGEEIITSGLEHENKKDVKEMTKPPNPKLVAAIREQKLKEKRMAELLHELAVFVVYLLLLFMVSAGNRDIRAYRQRAVVDKLLIHGGSKHSPMFKIDKVNNVPTFWLYLNQTFIPAVYYNTWYNDEKYNYTGYSLLRETKRLGITRLRQLRVTKDTCVIHKDFRAYVNECNDKFTSSVEDKQWYKKAWTEPKKRSGKQKKRFSPWKYATGKESRNIIPIMATLNTYPGGGYLGELGINEEFSQMYAKYMIKYRWVDKYTRAVFLEFTLYNANLNLISVGTLMFEFFNFGGALPRAEIYVSRLYRSLVPEHKVFLIFDIIFFFYTFYALFREARKLKRTGKSYFTSLDNITNAFCVFLGIATMGTYAMRAISLGSKIDEYNESPELFISFYQNAMYHEMVAILMSLIDFIAIIKFIAFLQFNKNFLMLIQTVIRAAPRISWFMAYLSLHVFAFVIFSYLLLGAERYNFSSLQRTVYSLNLLLLGVFDWDDFMARPKVGPALFMAYCILMTFMLMNIFMTILMEVYAVVQMDEELAKREFKLVEYLVDSVKLSIGLKKPLGLGDETRMRKKDPYIHRLNRTTRSIETRKAPKLNKLLNKVYVDEFVEDIEMLCLEIMRYNDEFYELVPCSYKIKLQAMLKKGEIDYHTYCEFMNIPDEDRLSIATTVSAASQRTMNSIPSDFDNSSISSSIEEKDHKTDTYDNSQQLETNEPIIQSHQMIPRKEPVLMEKYHSDIIPEEALEISDDSNNNETTESSLDISHGQTTTSPQGIPNESVSASLIDLNLESSTTQLITAGKRRKGKGKREKSHSKEKVELKPEPNSYINPVFQQEVQSSELSYVPLESHKDKDLITITEEQPGYPAIPTSHQHQSASDDQQMNIHIDLSESTTDAILDQSQLTSSRNLLSDRSNTEAVGGVVSGRRKKRKKTSQP